MSRDNFALLQAARNVLAAFDAPFGGGRMRGPRGESLRLLREAVELNERAERLGKLEKA